MKKRFILLATVLVFALSACTLTTKSNTTLNTTTTTNKVTTTTTSKQTTTTKEEFKSKAKNITNYVSKEGDIPLIQINTENNEFPKDKENYVKGTLKITEQPNEDNTLFEEASMGIRLRGNSTSAAPKKPFRIKFDEKQSLFGLPKAKSWVLLANYFDKSNIRNYLAYLTANKLSNLSFQPSSIFVDVEFNGTKLGTYILCEQMQTGKGRVDIEQDEWDISNPTYFMEFDALERIKEDGLQPGVEYFSTHDNYFAIKYPETPELTRKACMNISKIVDLIYTLVDSKGDYEKYLDVDSMIDFYLVQELFKNVDIATSSVYFYFQNGKLYAGPVWDFDIALEAVGISKTNEDYKNYDQSELYASKYNKLYSMLFNDPRFVQKVKDRYKEVRSILLEVYDEIEITKTYLTPAITRNNIIWPIPGDTSAWVSSRYKQEYLDLKTNEQHIEYLISQLNHQFNILDKAYL